MPFCRNCGAPVEIMNSECARCSSQAGQYYQPVPPVYPGPPPEDEAGKILGIVALIILIVVVVTIVLAAVLYVMVIDFDGGDYEYTPVGAWSDVSATSPTSAKLTFGTFSNDVAPMDIRIYISENGENIGYLSFITNNNPTPSTMMWVGNPTGASADYFDYNPTGEEINAGDYITFEGLTPDTIYEIEVFYIPTSSTVSMVGASSSFTTPE